jgi:hypothetical protein
MEGLRAGSWGQRLGRYASTDQMRLIARILGQGLFRNCG